MERRIPLLVVMTTSRALSDACDCREMKTRSELRVANSRACPCRLTKAPICILHSREQFAERITSFQFSSVSTDELAYAGMPLRAFLGGQRSDDSPGVPFLLTHALHPRRRRSTIKDP